MIGTKQWSRLVLPLRIAAAKKVPAFNTTPNLVFRGFARSSGPAPSEESPEDKARTFIVSLGHEQRIAKGVVDALSASGLGGGALLSTVRIMSGRVEIGEDAGLEALIAAVEQDLSRKEGKKAVKFWCVPPDAWDSAEREDSEEEGQPDNEDHDKMQEAAFLVEAFQGMSITDVAKFGEGKGSEVLREYIECACSGIMACSTCHVVIGDKWFGQVGDAEEAEQDMLDLAYNPKPASRLACNIVLTEKLDGVMIKLPRGANNMMDHIPFED